MAQQLQNITIAAPSFYGVNTQDSPVQQDAGFAAQANNAVIDKSGRITARKGYTYVSTNGADVLGSSRGITTLTEFVANDGTVAVISAGNNKIFTGTTTLVDATPAAYTITADNWKFVSFNDHLYMFQRGHEPLMYSDHDGVVEAMTSHAHATGTPPEGNEVLAAYGRLWVGDIEDDGNTLYWSDLLNGSGWSGGSTGSLDLQNYWSNGTDSIVALAAYNGFLIVFGKKTVLIFSGAESPSSMTLTDTITNVGCIARDSVQDIGTDLIFLSDAGIRSLGRTIQEKSNPISLISRNVNNDVLEALAQETLPIKSIYSQQEGFYIITFPSSSIVYCFDTKLPLQDGSLRATTWTALKPVSLAIFADRSLKLGLIEGFATYTGHYDNADTSYTMAYFSHPLDFQSPATIKMLKTVSVALVGNFTTQAILRWGYDYATNYYSANLILSGQTVAEYNVSEYNECEYTSGVLVNYPRVNTNGSGNNITIGVETIVSGGALSVQKFDILALIGRLY